jgi:hypothetical protein
MMLKIYTLIIDQLGSVSIYNQTAFGIKTIVNVIHAAQWWRHMLDVSFRLLQVNPAYLVYFINYALSLLRPEIPATLV